MQSENVRGPRAMFACVRVLLAGVLACAHLLVAQGEPSRQHTFFRVKAAETLTAPLSGRLLLFLKQGSGDHEVSIDEFRPTATWVAAQEIHDLEPGDTVEVD